MVILWGLCLILALMDLLSIMLCNVLNCKQIVSLILTFMLTSVFMITAIYTLLM